MNPGDKLGPYEIKEPLGAGGMGEVYRAHDPRLARDVAIKVLPADFATDQERLARFEREAKLLASLNHANIAAIYGLEDADGVRFIAMECVEGETLAARIARSGRIDIDEALEIARQIAEALEAAHENGVIHRDLKPANVVVTPDGKAKVLDFGLAKAYETDGSSSDISPDLSRSPTMMEATRTGVILGTAAYMSPEQARGKPVAKRTDIWAFGCVLYEMLAGRAAFGADNITDVLAAVVKEEPDWNALPWETPVRIEELLRDCLEKDPRARLHDIADARIGLEKGAGAPPRTARKARRAPPRLAAGWLALTAALVVVAVWITSMTTVSEPPRVVRANVTLPVGQRFPEFSAIAMAPDGSAYIYGTGNQDFAELLHLREIGYTEARPIPGTERAWYPFFKPDSSAIAFAPWGSDTIRVVSLTTGAAPVDQVRNAFLTGDWGRDGYIYYSRSDDFGLSRIPENGGTPENLTAPDRSFTTHTFPHALPQGNGVVFTIYDVGSADSSQIAVYAFESRRIEPLFPGIYARYVDSGHLVYTASDGSLHAVEFDATTLEARGSHRRFPDRLAPTLEVFGLSDDGTLIYPVPRPESGRLVRVDRSGRETALLPKNRQYRQVSLSPDAGRAAAEISDPDEGTKDIWVIELASDTLTPLTFSGEREDVAWSHDGKRVLFSSGGDNIHWAPADGTGGAEPLVASSGLVQYEPVMSGDGRLLFWREGDLGGDDTTMYFAPVDALDQQTAIVDTPNSKEHSPAPSPDGKWLAYVSDASGDSEVYLVSFPTDGAGTRVSRDGGSEPRWARDGSELYFRNAQGMWAVPVTTDGAGARELLFPERGVYRRDISHPTYDVFPDGSFMMIRKDSADYDLVLVFNFFEELKRVMSAGGGQ